MCWYLLGLCQYSQTLSICLSVLSVSVCLTVLSDFVCLLVLSDSVCLSVLSDSVCLSVLSDSVLSVLSDFVGTLRPCQYGQSLCVSVNYSWTPSVLPNPISYCLRLPVLVSVLGTKQKQKKIWWSVTSGVIVFLLRFLADIPSFAAYLPWQTSSGPEFRPFPSKRAAPLSFRSSWIWWVLADGRYCYYWSRFHGLR